jgi:hypothetical protein
VKLERCGGDAAFRSTRHAFGARPRRLQHEAAVAPRGAWARAHHDDDDDGEQQVHIDQQEGRHVQRDRGQQRFCVNSVAGREKMEL